MADYSALRAEPPEGRVSMSGTRRVDYTDDAGVVRPMRVPLTAPDEDAPLGLPLMTVDLTAEIDWARVAVELQNEVTRRGLLTAADLSRLDGQLEQSILSVLKRDIVRIYRNHDEGVTQ